MSASAVELCDPSGKLITLARHEQGAGVIGVDDGKTLEPGVLPNDSDGGRTVDVGAECREHFAAREGDEIRAKMLGIRPIIEGLRKLTPTVERVDEPRFATGLTARQRQRECGLSGSELARVNRARRRRRRDTEQARGCGERGVEPLAIAAHCE